MRFDLFTSIGVAIAGVIVAFVVTNLVLPGFETYEFKVVDKTQNATAAEAGYDYSSLTSPDNEVFNYDALNPTVEVYVGECFEVDADGNCVEQSTEEDEEGENNENGEEGTGSEENEQENE